MICVFEVLLNSGTELVKVEIVLNETSIVIFRSTTFEHNGQCSFVRILWKLNSGANVVEYDEFEVEIVLPVAIFHVVGVYLRHIR